MPFIECENCHGYRYEPLIEKKDAAACPPKPLRTSNLYVKNLHANMTNQELSNIFSEVGQVFSAKVVRNRKGVSSRFGFVRFKDAATAQRAISELNGKVVLGRQLYVAPARPKEKLKVNPWGPYFSWDVAKPAKPATDTRQQDPIQQDPIQPHRPRCIYRTRDATLVPAYAPGTKWAREERWKAIIEVMIKLLNIYCHLYIPWFCQYVGRKIKWFTRVVVLLIVCRQSSQNERSARSNGIMVWRWHAGPVRFSR